MRDINYVGQILSAASLLTFLFFYQLPLIGHVRPVDALEFSPDGQQLFSVDADDDGKVADYGEEIMLRFRESDLPKM